MSENEIEQIIAAVIASNAIGRTIPLWLISPSGHGKTTMLNRFSEIPQTRILSGHITPNAMRTQVLANIRKNNLHTLILDDIARFEPRYRSAVLELVQQICDGKVLVMQHEMSLEIPVCCGVILSSTDTFACRQEITSIMSDLGLDNRLLKLKYMYSAQRIEVVGRHIMNGNQPPEKITDIDISEHIVTEEEKNKIMKFTSESRQRKMIYDFLKLSDIDIFRYLRDTLQEV